MGMASWRTVPAVPSFMTRCCSEHWRSRPKLDLYPGAKLPYDGKTRSRPPSPDVRRARGDGFRRRARLGHNQYVSSIVPPPGIRIAEVRIQDFRAIKHICFPLSPRTTVLLGMNNVGKTAILAALDVALGGKRARVEDLHVDAASPPVHFEIDVRVAPSGGDSFDQPVVDIVGNAIQLGAAGEPESFVLRTRGMPDPKKGDPTITRTFLKGWATTRESAGNVDDHPSATVNQAVRALLTYELLDARRDGIEQLRNKRTFWGKSVADLRLEELVRKEIEAALRELQKKVLEASEPLQALQEQLRAVAAVLGRPDMGVSIAALPTEADALLRSMDVLLSESGQGPLPLATQGMGTRSLAALVIFRAYVQSVLRSVSPPGTLSIAGFEEPEAHLHPQGQRAVMALLDAVPGQHILTTHSAFVASSANLENIRIVQRDGPGPNVTWLPQGTFDSSTLTHVQRFVQRRNSEILFARVVALVEGHTEDAAMPVLAREYFGASADGHGISFVCVEGASSHKHIVLLLEKLGIPWVILADGDAAGTEGLKLLEMALGRPLTADDYEQLPAGADFEHHLINGEKLRTHVENAIAAFFGGTALADYRAARDGKKLKGGAKRDLQSAGWEERLVLDFMRNCKGLYGASLGAALVAAGIMPGFAKQFFDKLRARMSPPRPGAAT